MDKAEEKIKLYIKDYLKQNNSAQIIAKNLEEIGIGFWPIVDHITFRTKDVYLRAKELLKLGYAQDFTLGPNGVLDYGDWFAIVLRKPGLPAIFIDQGKTGEAGKTSLIPPWVKQFGDQTLHHVAIVVEDIDQAVKAMKALDIEFSGDIVGIRGSCLRQIFTKPEVRDNKPFSVLELAERHEGFTGFQPPQADSLMKSTKL